MNFFTADTHFGHANIIRYSKRPFLTDGDLTSDGQGTSKYHSRTAARKMDEKLILNWNSTITRDDDVYHCGDFALARGGNVLQYLRAINFKNLYFIWGNHDLDMHALKTNIRFYSDLLDRVHFLGDMAEIVVEGQRIVLCHYSMRVWNKSHAGSWHLYGHSHGSLPDDPHSLSFDVGVDCHDMKPISLEKVKEIMAKKFYVPIDHHGARPHETGGVGLSKEDYAKNARRQQYDQLKKEFGK